MELHETVRGGERVLIRPFQVEDKALYADFLRDVGPGDLRLRFFERVAELTAAEEDKPPISTTGTRLLSLRLTKIRATCLAACA
jgi:hypothetical protein